VDGDVSDQTEEGAWLSQCDLGVKLVVPLLCSASDVPWKILCGVELITHVLIKPSTRRVGSAECEALCVLWGEGHIAAYEET
jgi:hypothetical protein